MLLASTLVFIFFFLYVVLSGVYFGRRYENCSRKTVFVVAALPALWLGAFHAGLVLALVTGWGTLGKFILGIN
jgi:hypothetical protein